MNRIKDQVVNLLQSEAYGNPVEPAKIPSDWESIRSKAGDDGKEIKPKRHRRETVAIHWWGERAKDFFKQNRAKVKVAGRFIELKASLDDEFPRFAEQSDVTFATSNEWRQVERISFRDSTLFDGKPTEAMQYAEVRRGSRVSEKSFVLQRFDDLDLDTIDAELVRLRG